MTVLVVGATGNVGGRVLEGLLEQGVRARATTRNPESASFPEGVEVFRADLNDPGSFEPALAGVERVFLYADLDDPATLVSTLRQSGVRHVVLLSSSAATFDNAEADFNGARFYKIERAIEESGLEYTFLRPGTFAGNAARWSWGIRGENAVPLPYPEAVVAPIHEQDIADVAVLALTTDDLIGVGPIFTGPQRLTLRQQVAAIGAALGRDVAVIEQTDAEARVCLGRHVSADWVEFIVSGWRDAVGAEPEISAEYTRITGKPARTFAQWATDNANTFR